MRIRHCPVSQVFVCREPCDMRAETSERLEFIPALLYVEQHAPHQYACPCCEEHGLQTAEKPPVILPKSNAGPKLLVHAEAVS